MQNLTKKDRDHYYVMEEFIRTFEDLAERKGDPVLKSPIVEGARAEQRRILRKAKGIRASQPQTEEGAP